MTEHSHEFQGESEPDSSQNFELTWVKVWLHFGPSALEPSDEALAQSVTKILDRLDSQADSDSSHRAELLRQFQDMVVTVEDFEAFCESGFDADRTRIDEDGAEQVLDVPASELLGEDEEPADTDLDLTPEEERTSLEGVSFLEEIKRQIEAAAREHEGEPEESFADTTVEQVVAAIKERAGLAREVLVLEHDEAHANLYVLCYRSEDGKKLYTAQFADGAHEPSLGQEFEPYLQAFLDELPVRGGMGATEESFLARGHVTFLGEELSLNPDYRAVALVEMSVADLLWKSREAGLTEPIQTIPESEGWTYVISSAQTVLDLLSYLMRPAIVVQHSDTFVQLSLIMPGTDGSWQTPTEPETWADYLTKVAGNYEDTGDSGAVVNLIWGARKEILRQVSQGSEVQDMLWELPGLLPEPLLAVQKNDEVDNLTWIYGLDEGESRRLRQYVEDSDPDIGIESVLQLLDISPDIIALSNGSKTPEDFQDVRSWDPDMTLLKAVSEDFQAYPNGTDTLSQVQRIFRDKPWLFLAEGAINLGASGFLAARARRQFRQGQSARAAGSAAALLALAGALDVLFSAAQNRAKHQQAEVLSPDGIIDGRAEDSWFQDLKSQVEKERNKESGVIHTSETPHYESANGVLHSLGEAQPTGQGEEPEAAEEPKTLREQAGEKAKDAVQKFLRRFF